MAQYNPPAAAESDPVAGAAVTVEQARAIAAEAAEAAVRGTAITSEASARTTADATLTSSLATLSAAGATDAELAAAVSTLNTAIAAKQDSSTAATDAEVTAAVAALQAIVATDSELAAAVATINTALAAKQDASTAATDVELAAHTGASAGAHPATAVTFTPGGTVAATTVQGAIAEVASEADARFLTVESDDLAQDEAIAALGGDVNLRLRGLVRDMTSGDPLPSKQFVVEWDDELGEISDFDLEEIT